LFIMEYLQIYIWGRHGNWIYNHLCNQYLSPLTVAI
jgi:hypothetical protein